MTLEIKNVTKSFENTVILNDISITLEPVITVW